jgi:dipeptide/tripeptide permease
MKYTLLSGRLIRVFTNYSTVVRMSSDDGSLFGLGRGSLTAIGAVLMVIGIILLLAAATSLMAPSPNPFDFAANQARMNSSFVTAVIGMVFLAVGGGALRFGLMRPVTTYVASEASPAVERVSEAAAEGLKARIWSKPSQK